MSYFNKKLRQLPDLSRYTKLEELNCSDNMLTQLDNLPSSIIKLYCPTNFITKLDNLPHGLKILNCSNN